MTKPKLTNTNTNNSIVTGSDSNNIDINSTTTISKDTQSESSAQSQTVIQGEEITDVDTSSSASVNGEMATAIDENVHDTTSEIRSTDKIKNHYAALKLKRNDLIRYKEEDEWVEVQLTYRAGKVGSKYDSWWNIKNLKTGHESHEDLSCKLFIERIESQNRADEKDVVYVVQIPRYRHHESICKEAKERELSSWDEFEVYEVVKDEGQTRLGTNWVLTEKMVDSKQIVKARLTVRGDQEDTEGIRSDSPTVRKGNIKIFAAVAAKEGWEISTSDVTCAFLQGAKLERDVFILPPTERRIPAWCAMETPEAGLWIS